MEFKTAEERVLWELQEAEDKLYENEQEIKHLTDSLDSAISIIGRYEEYFKKHIHKRNGYIFVDSELVYDGEFNKTLTGLMEDKDED